MKPIAELLFTVILKVVLPLIDCTVKVIDCRLKMLEARRKSAASS